MNVSFALQSMSAVALMVVLGRSGAAQAASPLRMECDIAMVSSQQRMTRLLIVDLDHHEVIDGPMHWIDGGPNEPFPVDHVVAYVRRDGRQVEWGAENIVTHRLISLFSLDLVTGTYVYSGVSGTNARGHCRSLPNSI